MGPGHQATATDINNAYQLGKLIAQQGWVLLSGGRNVGVMDAASRGAKSVGGLTVGILPHNSLEGVSEAIDIPILTDMGQARNNINVLSSDVVIACGMGLGTASEVALALKNDKPVIILTEDPETIHFFMTLSRDKVLSATTPETAIELVREILRNSA